MKKKKAIRSVLAAILCLLLCAGTWPASVFAQEEKLYGIASEDEDMQVEAADEETYEQILDRIQTQANALQFGVTDGDFGMWDYGRYYSPFVLSSENDTINFEMDVPEIPENDYWASEVARVSLQFRLAVIDAQDKTAPVHFYKTTINDPEDNRLTATISMPASGKAVCALVQVNTNNITSGDNFEKNEFIAPKSILENTNGSDAEFLWNFRIKDPGLSWNITYNDYDAKIILELGDLELNTESVQLLGANGEPFDAFKIGEIKEDPADSGIWIIKLATPDDIDLPMENSVNIENHGLTDECTLSFNATLPHDKFTAGKNIPVLAELIIIDTSNDSSINSIYEMAETQSKALPSTTMTSAVTITPADMTIYEGGDAGYEAVMGDEETTYKASNSLPHPLFKITAPSETSIDVEDLIFVSDNSKQWQAVQVGDTNYYHFEPVENTETPAVRVTYTDAAGNQVLSDKFDWKTATDVFETYTIALYPGENENDFSNIKAYDSTEEQAESRTQYPISVNTGTLTVRAVEVADPTSDIVEKSGDTLVPDTTVESGKAVAFVPTDTTYTLNGLEGVNIPDDAKPSLLFDDIIASDGKGDDRKTALKDAVNTALNPAAGERHYEYKYLDLVDANNGNAWIKASNAVTIYWGYPTGTNKTTEFKILHFKDLHRDSDKSGFEVEDVATSEIDVITPTMEDQGIKFDVAPGDFSPYVLVWETSTTPDPGTNPGTDPDPTPDPDPDPTPTPEPEEPAQPELERDDHYAYIFGYEDNTIRPENDITRAEVATIFYRLLTDESREAYRTTDHDFTDVSADAWYAEPVATLANAGLLAGYEDGSFRPDAPITRAEYAAIATRFDELAAAESNFTDISGHWAENAINAAYGAGWVGGYEDDTFRPDQNISRAEAMALINRVLERAVDSEGMLDEMTHWADNHPAAWYYADVQEATHSHTYEREEGEQYENWTALVPHKVF